MTFEEIKAELIRRVKDARLVDESNPEQTVIGIIEEVFHEETGV